MRLRELAASRVQFGYRRLTVSLRGEGWRVNAKRIYRLYTEEGLMVRMKPRRQHCATHSRVSTVAATAPNERWSRDFVSARLIDGRWFPVLTVNDQYMRECVLLLADQSLTGEKMATELNVVLQHRPAPQSIAVDNGSEFTGRAMETCAYQLPGKPVETSFIQSFNGRLRDECLNLEVFFSFKDMQAKLAHWQQDDNQERPHSSLNDQAPAAFAAIWRWANDGREPTSKVLEVFN